MLYEDLKDAFVAQLGRQAAYTPGTHFDEERSVFDGEIDMDAIVTTLLNTIRQSHVLLPREPDAKIVHLIKDAGANSQFEGTLSARKLYRAIVEAASMQQTDYVIREG